MMIREFLHHWRRVDSGCTFWKCAVAIGLVLVTHLPVNADVTCAARQADIRFKSFVPWQTELRTMDSGILVECNNTDKERRKVSACFGIGAGSAGASVSSRQLAGTETSAGHVLPLILIGTESRANLGTFGDGAPLKLFVDMLPESRFVVQIPITAVLPEGNAAIPIGSYETIFGSGQTAISMDVVRGDSDILPDCNTVSPNYRNSFNFGVYVTVPKFCRITAEPVAMNFGEIDATENGPVLAQSLMKVRCTGKTAYRIELMPSNQDYFGRGVMTSKELPGESLAYQLFRDSAAKAEPWGAMEMFTHAGVGTGAEQLIDIYGAIDPQVSATPGNYTDRVTVTVTY